MRLPLANQLKARAGTPDKDARIKNGIVEIRGESSVVRNRPGVSEAVASGLGLFAQGGMQFGNQLVMIDDETVYYFDPAFLLVGGYDLILGSPFMVYAASGSYSLGNVVYYQDPDTGEIEPWYPYSPLSGIPPSKDPNNPGYWLWSKTPPVSNWYWKALVGEDAGTQVDGFGSCAAATQGYLTAHPAENYTYITTGCRSFNYIYMGNPPVSSSLSPLVVEMNSTPL